ncbi:MAG TPA: AMP-binding protein [Dehalococcoidales bacterium]|nr:AMP-binding protein [Dehalococcoidales bacterium]
MVFQPRDSLLQYFKDNVRATPGKVALSFYGYDMTYRELSQAIDRFAGGLSNLGVRKGDRVALFMQNCPQFVISYFGALQAGAIIVALNPMFKSAELEYEINDSGAGTLVALDYLYPEIKRAEGRIRLKNVILTSPKDYLPEKPGLPLPPEMEQPENTFPEALGFLDFLKTSPVEAASRVGDLKEDIALLQYTGGTTGLPKGAVITHYTLAHNAAAVPLWFGYTGDDVHTGVMPFFHVAGMVHSMCAALVSGGRLVILARFSPEVLARAIEKYRCTVLNTITTMYTALLDWPETGQYDLSSLRLVWEGGAPLPAAAEERLKRLLPGAFVGEGYGLTETLTGGVNTPIPYRKPGYIGIPFLSTDIKIVDLETGLKELKPGEEGEVVIKGPCVMKGYWNKPEDTEKQLKGGWLYTGDIGKMDEEGFLAIVSRKKELIKCSGFSVFPSEIEGLLYKHPAIAEVSVIGVPDPYRGETPKAFVVLRPEYRGKTREEDILDWAKDNMASYKRPRILEFRDELPKSGAGKVLRRVLVEEEAAKTHRTTIRKK